VVSRAGIEPGTHVDSAEVSDSPKR